MEMATADAAVDRIMVFRRGGERWVTTDGRRAASRRVVDSLFVVVLVGGCTVLPVGRTKAIQLVAVAARSTADSIIRGVISVVIISRSTVVLWRGIALDCVF